MSEVRLCLTFPRKDRENKTLIHCRFGVVYCGEIDDLCTVRVDRQRRKYRRLHTLEFDSDRKRMSVIVEFPDGSIWLLCKGAESTVLPRCVIGRVEATEQHIKDYALASRRVDPLLIFADG